MSIQQIEDQLGQLATQKQFYFKDTIQNQQNLIAQLESTSRQVEKDLAAKSKELGEKTHQILEYENRFGQIKCAIAERDSQNQLVVAKLEQQSRNLSQLNTQLVEKLE